MKHFLELPYLFFQTGQQERFYIYKINVNRLLFPVGVFPAKAVSKHICTGDRRTLLV